MKDSLSIYLDRLVEVFTVFKLFSLPSHPNFYFNLHKPTFQKVTQNHRKKIIFISQLFFV